MNDPETDVLEATPTEDDGELAPASSAVDGDQPETAPESIVEALLFSTDNPLSPGKISQILEAATPGDVKKHIQTLNGRYEESGSAFRIESIAGGFRMFTLPVYNRWLSKMHTHRAESRLSPAALETLAIVAYKQPVLRADIESIRGVAVGDMMGRLREMKLTKIVGRAEEIGRPLLYGTTTRFLEVFGLSSLKDLPKLDQDAVEKVPQLKIPQAQEPPDSQDETSE